MGLPKRGIREETCRKFGYQVGEDDNGKPIHIASFTDDKGRPVAQKIRSAGKKFSWRGDREQAEALFGQHIWGGTKSVVLTEGEIDALSVAQCFDCKWPVVSLPDGAQSAPKAIKKAYDWLCQFERIVLCFDMDDPGQQAAQKVAEMLPIGRVFIMRLDRKDANDVLVNDGAAPIVSAFWNAVAWRPDGIVSGEELWSELLNTKEAESVPYPWQTLNEKTLGIRRGELVTVTAGSGIGKTTFVREIAYSLLNMGETVGMLMLEESTQKTAFTLMGLAMNRRIDVKRGDVSEDDLRKAFTQTVGCGRLYLYDHFGSTEIDNLLNRVRYMAKALGCTYVVVDHLSIVVSGLEGNDERKLIDRTMTLLRTLVQETGIGLIIVSHLRRPEGKGHEEGAQVSLGQLRGSHAIAQLSDIVVGLERNQQDKENKDRMSMRVLKNRFTGDTGEAGDLLFDDTTGRLNEFLDL
jgi:twinkle protein